MFVHVCVLLLHCGSNLGFIEAGQVFYHFARFLVLSRMLLIETPVGCKGGRGRKGCNGPSIVCYCFDSCKNSEHQKMECLYIVMKLILPLGFPDLKGPWALFWELLPH